MKSKETKRSLFLSVISLLLCFAILAGNTFAWFTAVVKTEKNEIVVGNLDVEMEYSLDFEDWKTVDTTTKLFNEDALWQPGYSEVVYLKVKNAGDLSLRYQLSIKINEEQVAINKNDKIFKLSDYIQVGAVKDIEVGYSSNTNAILAVENDTIALSTFSKNGVIEAGGADQYFALVVFMPESVGNAANYRGDAPTIDFGVSLYATQIGGDIESDTPTVVLNESVAVFSGAQAEQANESIESIWTEDDTTYMTVSENSPLNVLSEGDIFYLEGNAGSPFGDVYIGKVTSVGNDDTSTFNLRNTSATSGITYTIESPLIDEVFDEIDIDFYKNIPFNDENVSVYPLVDGVEQIEAETYAWNPSFSTNQLNFKAEIDILKLLKLKTDSGYDPTLYQGFETATYTESYNIEVYQEINNVDRYHRANCEFCTLANIECEKAILGDVVDAKLKPCTICKPALREKDDILSFEPELKLTGTFGFASFSAGACIDYSLLNGLKDLSVDLDAEFVSNLTLTSNLHLTLEGRKTSTSITDKLKLEGINQKMIPLVCVLYNFVETKVCLSNKDIVEETNNIPLSIAGIIYFDASGELKIESSITFGFSQTIDYHKTVIKDYESVNTAVDKGDSSYGFTLKTIFSAKFDAHVGASLQIYLANVNIVDLAILKFGIAGEGTGELNYCTDESVQDKNGYSGNLYAKLYLKWFELQVKMKIILSIEDGIESTDPWFNVDFILLGHEEILKEWKPSEDNDEDNEEEIQTPSDGLAYTLNSNKTSYSVSGIGTCKSTKLIIPETYDGKPVTAITAEAFKDCTQLISVVVPASVKEIGKGAFSGCSSIESMTIPFVGASPSPGATLFNEKNCFGYIFGSEEYDGSYYVSQYVYCIDGRDFYIPEALKKVILTGDNIQYGSFSELKVENITLLGNVTSIPSDAFRKNTTITEIRIPKGCTQIGFVSDGMGSGSVFRECKNLQNVYIPRSLKNIDQYCFNGCNSLTDVYYEGSEEEWNAILIGNYNTSLINATIHYNCDYELADSEESEGSKGLKYTLNDDKISYSVSGIGTCTDSHVIVASEHNGLPVTSVSDSAFNKSNFAQITLPNNVINIGKYAFNKCENLQTINISNSVLNIDSYAFAECSSLTKIMIPKSLENLGRGVFVFCENLQNIDVDSQNTEYCSIKGNLYSKDQKRLIQYTRGKNDTSFVIPNGVTNVEQDAFYACTNLKNITIPNSVTNFGECAFTSCINLESITIPDSVTNISPGMFRYCRSLQNITLGNSITSIGEDAFEECESLKNITIPNSVTSIGKGAFSFCRNLENIIISNGVKSIETHIFYYCQSLQSITIPDSVTTIQAGAFEACSKLQQIIIPNSVTSIGACAFALCKALQNITFIGTKDEWNTIDKFIDWNHLSSNWNHSTGYYTVYCTDGEIQK